MRAGLGRTVVYGVLAVAMIGPVAIDVLAGALSVPKGVVIWVLLNAALWSSWPRYRSIFLRQIAMSLTLIVAVSLALGPAARAVMPSSTPTLQPLVERHLRMVGPTLVGFNGVQNITTNEHGHRTNGAVDYAHKPVGALRIVAIGASTTEDIFLDDAKTWPSHFGAVLQEALHRKVEVINTALSGTRASQQLAALEDSAAYSPDIAIFMIGINDWNAAISAARSTPADRFLQALTPWSFYHSVLFEGANRARQLIGLAFSGGGNPKQIVDESGDSYRVASLETARKPKVEMRLSAVDDGYKATVGQMLAECRARKLICVFTDQPTSYAPAFESEQRWWMIPPAEPYALTVDSLQSVSRLYNHWLGGTVVAAGQTFCPIADQLPASTAFFFDDCHFNEGGASRVAKLVSDCLLKDGKAAQILRGAP